MSDKLRLIPAVVGVILNLAWVAVLFAICATDGGHWRADRVQGCVFWCGLMAVPAGIAITGLIKGSRSFLIAAASLCAPLALISLAGAGLPMIVPGILFGIAASRSDASREERMLGAGYFALAGVLIVLGFIGMFSIGAPFFLYGLLMLAMAPIAKKGSHLLPMILAVVGAAMIVYFIFTLQGARSSSANCIKQVSVQQSGSTANQVKRAMESRPC